MREIIGWGSALLLIPTFGLQAYKQWKERREHAPASTLWFFILALLGVAGQVIYSWMLGNWVYFVLNACLVVTNTLGLALAIHRRGVRGIRPRAEFDPIHDSLRYQRDLPVSPIDGAGR